jgi:internalin A
MGQPYQPRKSVSDDGSRVAFVRSELATLPGWLIKPNLITLNLRGNELTSLPESFGKLSALDTLNLSSNELQTLPDSFGNLASLTVLNLSDNWLTRLPDSIGNLTSLITLDLSGNRLSAIPESIGNLTALTKLDLSYNQLTKLPWQLADLLTSGLQVNLEGNPLATQLPELVGRGSDAVATYLRSLDDAVEQYEAKLLLVSEGNVGKTSLLAALRGAPFVEGRPTTHGMEIWPLAFRHPNDQDMTLRVWDFGGQEVYRVTHQFFFSHRAIYIVVWNARQGQEQDAVEGWLRRIRLRVGQEVRVMIVATHCSERVPELDYPHLQNIFRNMLVGGFEVDNRTGLGVSRLRMEIGQQAIRLPQMGERISLRWVAARDAILARAKTELQIRYEEFKKICEHNEVRGSEITTLAQLMHDLGHIIYYGEDEGLKDIVVLSPEWLTKAISYVLEDRPTREARGILDHARLREIWQDREDDPVYPAQYHPYFLRLMEKFDVSYRLEDDDSFSLIAQLVSHERPVLPWTPSAQPSGGIRSLSLVCRLSEPAPGLIPWLTVRHHRATTGMYWRRGVFLKHPIRSYASEALIELYSDTDLALEVRAPSPDLYFNVLRDSIEDLIRQRWPGLAYLLFIPCLTQASDGSMCPGEFRLDGLLRLREGGRNSVPCMDCVREYEISLLLTGFTTPTDSLETKLDQLHDRLTRVEGSMVRAEGQAAEIAQSVRRVLTAVSAEVTDCPRLMTFSPERPSGVKRLRIDQHHYRLTLWCEHPGYWHPWIPATYEIEPSKEWLIRIRPYVKLIFKTLRLVMPFAGIVLTSTLPADQLEIAKTDLEFIDSFTENFSDDIVDDSGESDLGQTTGMLTLVEGQALRGLRAILFQHDPLRRFGGLRRVQAPSGDLLWVCMAHYGEYDPGLPTVP